MVSKDVEESFRGSLGVHQGAQLQVSLIEFANVIQSHQLTEVLFQVKELLIPLVIIKGYDRYTVVGLPSVGVRCIIDEDYLPQWSTLVH